MEAHDWQGCSLVSIDPEIVHGELVFKGTRLPVEIVTNEVYAYMELCGQSEDEAIASALESFPTTPGGAAAIREVLGYREAHEHQMQP
jgi:uncharacterized protein (DUF433 family)